MSGDITRMRYVRLISAARGIVEALKSHYISTVRPTAFICCVFPDLRVTEDPEAHHVWLAQVFPVASDCSFSGGLCKQGDDNLRLFVLSPKCSL
jgi:hypothetical protein